MDRNYYIKLTLGVYRVTDLFPKKEPLKAKIREKADNLLANLVLFSQKNPDFEDKELRTLISNDIAVINSLFELAEPQNWISPRNFSVLKREYGKINQLINEKFQEFKEAQPAMIEKKPRGGGLAKKDLGKTLNERQKKILEILENEEKIQVWESKKIFPEVSKRTLRRDFEYLLGQGLVKRIGERNSTFYKLVRH